MVHPRASRSGFSTRSPTTGGRTAWVGGRRAAVPPRLRLSRVLAQYPGHHLDLDVEFARGARRIGFRVVVLPGRDPTMTRLCTNLPRTPFSAGLVAWLSRFRWQRERCFTEWKSYANLHKSKTANPHVAEGLMWASLCAAIRGDEGARGWSSAGGAWRSGVACPAGRRDREHAGRLAPGWG